MAVAQLLVERGADLSIRVKLPGYYERSGEVVECTPLGYARRFPSDQVESKAVIVILLRKQAAA